MVGEAQKQVGYVPERRVEALQAIVLRKITEGKGATRFRQKRSEWSAEEHILVP
jgi:hypothetical protein